MNQKLHDARVKAGLSVREAADKLGIIPQKLELIESGSGAVTIGTLLNLCHLYGLKVDSLVTA